MFGWGEGGGQESRRQRGAAHLRFREESHTEGVRVTLNP